MLLFIQIQHLRTELITKRRASDPTFVESTLHIRSLQDIIIMYDPSSERLGWSDSKSRSPPPHPRSNSQNDLSFPRALDSHIHSPRGRHSMAAGVAGARAEESARAPEERRIRDTQRSRFIQSRISYPCSRHSTRTYFATTHAQRMQKRKEKAPAAVNKPTAAACEWLLSHVGHTTGVIY